MLKLAICDDDQIICTQIEAVIQKLSKHAKQEIEIDVFYTGEKLIETLKCNQGYDVLFLDIELQGLSGVEIGKFIREEQANELTRIIYISSKQSYAMELFQIRPFDFLIKPIHEVSIQRVMRNIYKLIKKDKYYFECKSNKTYYKILLEEILYFESYDRKVKVVCKDKEIIFYGKLKEVQQQLSYANFLAIHKSYFINYRYIKELEYDQVMMANHKLLPISQSHRQVVRKEQLRIQRETHL